MARLAGQLSALKLPRGGSPAWFALATLLPLAGCASDPLVSWDDWTWRGWSPGYETAERQAASRQQPVLFYFKNPRNRKDDIPRRVEQACDAQNSGFVRCQLFNSREPDRRYAAQFGIERAPALILVHTDGTFHATTGPFSYDSIQTFLADSHPPGLQPRTNPYLPRDVEFTWRSSLRDGGLEARRQDRDLIVVYYRGVSDDWLEVESALRQPEVYRHVAGMVHCREAFWGSWEKGETPFGTLSLPAMVIVRRDNSHGILEMATSTDAVARFVADRPAPSSVGDPATAGADTAASSLVQSP